MKKILAMGLAAVVLAALAQQRASAWSKCNFGIGLKIGFEGGGNSVLWGMFKGANVPGHGDDHGHHGGYADHGDFGYAAGIMEPSSYAPPALAAQPFSQQPSLPQWNPLQPYPQQPMPNQPEKLPAPKANTPPLKSVNYTQPTGYYQANSYWSYYPYYGYYPNYGYYWTYYGR